MPVLVSGKVKWVFCGGVSGVFSVVFFVIFRWDGGLAADGECVVFFCRMAVFSQIAVFCAFWQDGAYAVRYSCVRTGKQQVNHDDRCGDEMRVCDFPDGSKKT